LEEADSILGKKSAENTALSRLLSMSDGVVNSNMKFVICANVDSISKIDPSLTRPGRSYRTIVFERINPEQANVSRACIGKPPVNFTGQVTLATALNAVQEQDEDFGKRAPMGFVGTTR
jgi:ATP-dependent 26S proteasome regulatory subunit